VAAAPLTPRAAALLGKGGGAPPPPTAAGDVVREGSTGGVGGLESGRGILEGVRTRSGRREARMGDRSGRAVRSEEEVLTWTGISWTGGGVDTEEEWTAAEAGGLACVFVGLSMLARGGGDFVAGLRLRPSFLFGNGGGIATIDGWGGGIGGGNLLCS